MKLLKHKTNFYCLDAEEWQIWFSYETPIAFVKNNRAWISQNEWGVTTGKHLNEIDPYKPSRIPHSELLLIIKLNT